MADIKLKDNTGVEKIYNGVNYINVPDATSGTVTFYDQSVAGAVNDVKVDGASVVTNKVANIDLATPLATKQDTLPSGSNDTYLHKNANTGELEWSTVQSTLEIVCSAEEPTIHDNSWWYFTPEPTVIELDKFTLENRHSLEIKIDY